MRNPLHRPAFRQLAPSTETRLMRPFLAATGIVVGAGLFETRVVIPQWASASNAAEVEAALERSGHIASGTRFWALLVPAVVPLTVANLYAALRSEDPRRGWWVASAGTMTAVSIATAGYYVPELRRLRHARDLADEQLRSKIKWRVRLDHVRLGVLVAAWFAGLKALSRD